MASRATLGLAWFLGACVTGAPLPNFILILADDMGFGDLGANTNDQISETPHLDALAHAGIRFTDMHAGARSTRKVSPLCIYPQPYSLV